MCDDDIDAEEVFQGEARRGIADFVTHLDRGCPSINELT